MGPYLRSGGYWFDVRFIFGTVAGRPTSKELMGVTVDVDLLCVLTFYSYAEMDSKQKNAISHRGRALEKLRAYLEQAQTQDVASASA